ncbi:hypothetical protein PC111_g4022 [Phytophthora cactorum]|nr:hypothetical protein PC111_g4022 [Phytophthora cactorum]
MATPSPSIDFIIPGLSGLLSEALATAADHCHDMRENQHMCIHVCDRLHEIPQQFPDARENCRRHLSDIVTSFVNFLLKRSELSFIKHLANNRKVEETILSFHEDIDKLLLSMAGNLTDWRQQWMGDRVAKLEEFEALTNNQQVLAAEKGSTSFMEGLFMLKFELDYKADKYRTDDIAKHHLQLMRRTLTKLLRMSSAKMPAIPDCCGTSMTRTEEISQTTTPAMQQKNACPRCEENVLSTDHFCRHCGYCLDADPAFA